MDIKVLKDALERCGKSKAQVAQECGISRITLDNALKGSDIRISILESLAKVLQIKVCKLFGEEPHTATASDHSVAAINSDVKVNVSCSVLEEKIAMMEKLLEEKERTIQILMKNK